MKLAYICTEKLPSPAVKGGAIQMMIDGVAPLLCKTHELTIFSISDEILPERERKNNIDYIRFPRVNYRTRVAEELKNHQFDVIHVFNRPKNILIYKESSPKSQFVLSLHNDMFSEGKISEEDGKKAIEAATLITTVSHYIKNQVTRRFPEAETKIHVVYSGVNLTSYPPVWTAEGQLIRKQYRRKYNLDNKKVILFVGRLSKTKGPHLLIKAMKHIIKQHEDVVLVIAGGKWFSDNRVNSYVRYLYNLAKPLGKHVVFTKFIPPEEIPNIFLMADIFVCSSQWNEPLARVHYEAMAAGIPLITTNRGGNGEIVEDENNGILVDHYDHPLAFVDRIDYLVKKPGYAQWLAYNGRKFVEENFDFTHVAKRLESVYIKAYESENKLETLLDS